MPMMRQKLLLLAALLVLPALCQAQEPPVFVTKWGAPGSQAGQFNAPTGMGLDGGGNVYVVDHDRVQKFTNSGQFVGQFGGTGSANGQFNGALDVAIDPAGNIYVTDSFNFRIQVFDQTLAYVRQWPAFYAQSYIALDPTGQYAYLARPDSIRKYRTADGAYLGAWFYSTGAGPFGFAVGPSGDVYTSVGSSFVRRYTALGAEVSMWGGSGTADGLFQFSEGVAVGPDESVYACDTNSRIQKFSSTGTFISKWGSLGSGNGQFGGYMPDIVVDGSSSVFVLDKGLSRIQKFSYLSTRTLRQSLSQLKQRYR